MPRETDPIADSVWIRPPRSRRGRPQLSREEIVTAAVGLLDAEGLDGLSMRRLAATIGAGATSLYFYVAGKDELMELAVDEIMGEVDIPDAAEVGWREAAAGFAREFRAMMARHPWAVAVLGVTPAIGPNAMRATDRAVALFGAAGLTGQEIAWASALLLEHAMGAVMSETAMRTFTARTGRPVTEVVRQMDDYVESFSTELPNFTGWWRDNNDVDMEKNLDTGFEFGLARILDGLAVWLAEEGR
ncbi:TetR/AcrR family transcriptional regulator C-terminal domain-containing protein [Actinomadura terrae]|uniref:TetR/AcrR family transcriptional regulator C-terminal domain-containing protein n=1 Tax=Actinomadura terrae TaxID=604353 RepID=UPI001FA6B91C|nr:TetR/AcrR family transcriptional regulator C-terminal domain-containing protein [Actinomadura terrae]